MKNNQRRAMFAKMKNINRQRIIFPKSQANKGKFASFVFSLTNKQKIQIRKDILKEEQQEREKILKEALRRNKRGDL